LLPAEPLRRRLTLGADTFTAQVRSRRQRRRPPEPEPARLHLQRRMIRKVLRSPTAPATARI